MNIIEHAPRYQHGTVELELVRADGVTKETGKLENFVTPIGRQLDNNMGPGRLLSVGGDLWGLTHVHQAMSVVGRAVSSTSQMVRGDMDTELTLVLLSLGEEVNSIDENTSCIYIHANDGTAIAAKVVGYANGNITPKSDDKEGYLDLSKPEYVGNKFYQVNRWVFDTDVAVGTIDAVAMMPASAIKQLGGSGISTWMCIDKGNWQDVNFTAKSTAFCPPGIAGFTGNNGVLLNYTHNSNSRHKLDLSSFDMIDLDASEPWYTLPTNTMDWIIIDDYIYVLTKDLNNGTGFKVNVHNKTNMFWVASYELSSNTGSDSFRYAIKGSFLYKSGVLYVTSVINSNSTSAGDRYYVLTKGAKAYFSAQDGKGQTDYSAILTVPSMITNHRRVAFGNFGDKYLMYVLQEPQDGNTCMAYVFTDIDNIAESMEMNKIFYNISPYTLKYKTDTRAGFMRIGFAPDTNVKVGFSPYDCIVGNKVLMNNTSGTYQEILNNSQGLWISDESEHGNCYSIRLLSEPVEKGSSDKLYVSYGYQR